MGRRFSDALAMRWVRRRTARGQGLVTNVRVENGVVRVAADVWLESLGIYQAVPDSFKDATPPLDPGLGERAEYYIRRGFELLDAVPRDNPFWDKTSNQSTDRKAVSWFWQVLEANPDDAEARWIVVAFGLKWCWPGLEALLAPLVLEDPANLRWLAGATVWAAWVSGADYTAALRHELTMLNDNPGVRFLLEADTGNDELGRAVLVARSVLAGNSIFKAAEGLTDQ